LAEDNRTAYLKQVLVKQKLAAAEEAFKLASASCTNVGGIDAVAAA